MLLREIFEKLLKAFIEKLVPALMQSNSRRSYSSRFKETSGKISLNSYLQSCPKLELKRHL